MSLLTRLEGINARLRARVDRPQVLERRAAQLEEQAEAVEELMTRNAILAIPPEYLEDTVRVIRRGITATDDVHPVVVAILVRWCHQESERFAEAGQEAGQEGHTT